MCKLHRCLEVDHLPHVACAVCASLLLPVYSTKQQGTEQGGIQVLPRQLVCKPRSYVCIGRLRKGSQAL
jgi:hypothetical protein